MDVLKHDVGFICHTTAVTIFADIVLLVLSNVDDLHEHTAKKATGKCISWSDPHVKD